MAQRISDEQIVEELSRHGLRATRRRAALRLLRRTPGHPTALEIHEGLLRQQPNVSQKTWRARRSRRSSSRARRPSRRVADLESRARQGRQGMRSAVPQRRDRHQRRRLRDVPPARVEHHPETYPKFQAQLKKVALLRDMVNWCILNPLEGKELAADDAMMVALEAYILAQRAGKPLAAGKH
jgi:hypothetical protein